MTNTYEAEPKATTFECPQCGEADCSADHDNEERWAEEMQAEAAYEAQREADVPRVLLDRGDWDV